MHPGCRTSIFGENRAYCIRDFTVICSLVVCILSLIIVQFNAKFVTELSHKMATNYDMAAQMRFLATARRQSAPPRCNPFVIVLQVSAAVYTC